MYRDSLTYNEGEQFKTRDETFGSTCPDSYHGAFWYNSCFYINPNGLYQSGDSKVTMSMTDWDNYLSARTWKMMFRRL